ncbi:hypothetical protein JI664_03470 [Rhodobacter sp. NTK016B]|uniref:pyocin knob domain-containing protein n=1 Tax=Rhodobacter sp. NTK016B TaxID=2759676 RepID=UPI001A8D5B3B|nr:pyocin knob domain-containing protein [Rhodobacter sp. NTK016B]MBN8291016.1 hypothetical protein [Rhodobacter sp. NTK016B]
MTTLYKTGAISIGAGSTNVTGSGTAWTTSGTRPGDLLIAGGAVAEIASVTSAAGITLANAWPAATQAAVNYAILQLDDGLRALIAANTLLQALDGGTLTSLADLPGVANKLPYFTGENVMGLTDFGAAARAFLAADPVMTASALDATEDRLLKVGDFGLGVTGFPPNLGNWDAIDTPSGDYVFSVTTTGNGTSTPPGWVAGNYGFVRLTRFSATALIQTAERAAGTRERWSRRYSGSSWGEWVKDYTQHSVLGLVSQSGGVPTGGLFERGSNSNGEYLRLPDGTQFCWIYASPNFAVAGNYGGSFPAAFVSTPAGGSPSIRSGSSAARDNLQSLSSWGPSSPTGWFITRDGSGPGGSAAEVAITLMFIGRWF